MCQGQGVIEKRRPHRGEKEGLCQKWTNVDMGRGCFSYSGRPQTVPLLANLSDSLLPSHMAQKWAEITPFYRIMNLVLHSNFDIYMFYLLIFC